VLNRFPYNAGHLMIVPYRHLANIDSLKSEENQELFDLAKRCMTVLNKNYKPQGYNLGMNIGKVAGAGRDKNVHLHIVPRWSGDSNFMPVISDIRVISEDTKKICKKLNKALAGFPI
jgi:ATP adenylyltransferase